MDFDILYSSSEDVSILSRFNYFKFGNQVKSYIFLSWLFYV